MKSLLFLLGTFFCLNCFSQSAAYYIKMGNKKNKINDYHGALNNYLMAFRINSKDTAALFGIISSKNQIWLKEFNNNDNIMFYLNKYVELNKNKASAYITRSEIESNRGKTTEAILDLDIAIGLDNKNATAYYEREILRHNIGDKDGAEMDYKEYRKLTQKDTTEK